LLEKEAPEKPAAPAAPAAPRTPVGFIAIAVGEGVSDMFRDLGAGYVVRGGQTMNPSTDDILTAIEAVNSDTVFILPNNKNIFLVADRAAEMTTDKRVVVLPTAHFTQGLSAMMVYDESADIEENIAAMNEAIGGVTTLSFTRAVRDADIDGMNIKDGQVLGLLNGKVKAADPDILATLAALADNVADASFLSIYCGADASAEVTAKIEAMLKEKAPNAEVLVADGGQPLYDYVIAAE
jgi:dihydroxyacetone kinase-like predicted kinase